MNALHDQFVTEARELIQQATDDLMALEQEGDATERIERVFRAFHTLKGSAGIVELPAMSLTLHAAEDLLAAIQAGRLSSSTRIIDQALACLDQVSQWVNEFETRGALPSEAGQDARAMADQLRALLPAAPGKAGAGPARGESGAQPVRAESGGLPAWIGRLVQSKHKQISAQGLAPGTLLHAISYEPHQGCFFNGEDPFQLMRQVPDLIAFQIEPREPWPAISEFDPYNCNLRLLGISAGDRAELSRIFRLVPDQVQIAAVSVDDLPAADVSRPDAGAAPLVRSIVEEQRLVLLAASRKQDFDGRVGAASRVAANALRHGGRADLATRIEAASATSFAQRDAAALVAALGDAAGSLTGSQVAGPNEAADPGGELADPAAAGADRVRFLRIDENKIDALVNLVGELIVAKNGLAHLARRMDEDLSGHELSRALRREHEAIDRLVIDLHNAILELRMVPVAQVFRSFPRLVRDMSHQLGKDVAFVTRGETTEADKSIVDRLFEPLIHLVRNALDHGVETAEQRRAAGKSAKSTISLQASRAGDRFVVAVADDGRGIDPEVVRRKAREAGIMPAGDLAALADDQVVDLIFSAGFSTAAQVSDISGRGIGMDVVRATVAQMGGRISLASRVGAGTTVSLDLPMTIALSRIMVVAAGGQLFGIPMDGVMETVRLAPGQISRIKNNDGFVLHDRVVPICSLAELMRLPEQAKAADNARLLIVAEAAGRVAALEVDAIEDRLEVVLKPMQGLLAGARGYSGTTLLGDGQVLLVLDLKEVLP